MSGFSVDWLDLREDADRRARDSALRARALEWLMAAAEPPATDLPLVVDLGAGTGSTLRSFGAEIATRLRWRLVDLDPALLDEARRRHGEAHRIETCVSDLAEVATLPLTGARLVTASALFDLVSPAFLASLATVLRRQGGQQPVALYSALNYNGMTRWYPAHPLDEPVLAAFNRDQQRDKGFGPALGPDAGAAMRGAFTEAGFTVQSADSPWCLGGADHALVSALIEGIAGVAGADPALERQAVDDWQAFRLENRWNGTCTVGHTDLLAAPAPAFPEPDQ